MKSKTKTPPKAKPKKDDPNYQPHPGGRPSKYKEEYCEMLIEWMKKGYSFESFGSQANVHFDTLYEWNKVHPKFSEAKRIGLAHAMAFYENIGLLSVTGQTPNNFNSTVWVFSMKNKFGWRDKIENDTTLRVEPLIIEDDEGDTTTMGIKQT